jgi:indolepyruvate ferredoxin oxidoreductase alpha subunit
MASSQNEQDNRRYAVAAGVPMLEPSDSQEAYEYTLRAIEVSEHWSIPVLLRMTTRVCHSKTIVIPSPEAVPALNPPGWVRDIASRVMIPAYARPAHRRLRRKLAEIAAWAETNRLHLVQPGDRSLGIVTSGVSYQHVREAAPHASVFKLGMTYPIPVQGLRRFAESVDRCLVIEEGDAYLLEAARTAGIAVEDKPEMYRFGELTVPRVRRIVARDRSPEPRPQPGTPPALCPGCPHRVVFTALKNLDCIVSGDIGCYSLGVLPPFEAIDALVCMGASIGVGLGMRHTLPPEQARRVVSVIGDSTFVHSGITGLVEMIYNPPSSGHLLLILDNGTTAMTGMQEHPGTGRSLNHHRTGKVIFEDLARTLGIANVDVIDPTLNPAEFEALVKRRLDSGELSVIIARRDCLLATAAIKRYEKCNDSD